MAAWCDPRQDKCNMFVSAQKTPGIINHQQTMHHVLASRSAEYFHGQRLHVAANFEISVECTYQIILAGSTGITYLSHIEGQRVGKLMKSSITRAEDMKTFSL